MILGKLNLSKLDKAHLFTGKNGDKWLDIVLFENDGPDKYGNDYMIVQGISKEAREAGGKGPILGNGKNKGSKAAPAKKNDGDAADKDDLPF